MLWRSEITFLNPTEEESCFPAFTIAVMGFAEFVLLEFLDYCLVVVYPISMEPFSFVGLATDIEYNASKAFSRVLGNVSVRAITGQGRASVLLTKNPFPSCVTRLNWSNILLIDPDSLKYKIDKKTPISRDCRFFEHAWIALKGNL